MATEDLLQLILLSATLIMTFLGWRVSKMNKEDIVRLEDSLDTKRERRNLLFKRKVEIANEFLNCLDSSIELIIKIDICNNRIKELEEKQEVETDEMIKESKNNELEQARSNLYDEISVMPELVKKFRISVTRISHFDEFKDTEIFNISLAFFKKLRSFAEGSVEEFYNIDISNEITSDYYKIYKLVTEKLDW